MKRNKNLVELSKDHHHGLLLGWKIKQGFKLGVSLIADLHHPYVENYPNEFWTR